MIKQNHFIQLSSEKFPITRWSIQASLNPQGAGLGAPTPKSGNVDVYFDLHSKAEVALQRSFQNQSFFMEVILISQFFRGKRADLMTDQHVAIFNNVRVVRYSELEVKYATLTYEGSNISTLSFPELFKQIGNIFK